MRACVHVRACVHYGNAGTLDSDGGVVPTTGPCARTHERYSRDSGYSDGTHRALTGYSQGTHRVLRGVLTTACLREPQVLTGYSEGHSMVFSKGVLTPTHGYSRGTHKVLKGYSQGTHRALKGYSQGTERVLLGTHGVLKGYSQGYSTWG